MAARDLRAPGDPVRADFIGSLNTIDLRVDEVVGGYAVMRFGRRRRVVVPADERDGRRRCASRSAGRVRRARREAPTAGRVCDGTIADVVYLGMYTQLHVDTPRRANCQPPARRRRSPRSSRAATSR